MSIKDEILAIEKQIELIRENRLQFIEEMKRFDMEVKQ